MSLWSRFMCFLGLHHYHVIEVKIANDGVRRALLRCEHCKSYFHCLVLSDKLLGIWPLVDKEFLGMK